MILTSTIHRARSGVTLLELMTVIVIISILVVVASPVLASIKARTQKAKCIGNLRSLHTAANLYVQDNQHWPQIRGDPSTDNNVVDAWINAFSPYGLTAINWACPSIQEALQAPNLSAPQNKRLDYIAMPFGTQRDAPFQYARQPWFIETTNMHGNGQEILFPDGHVEEAADVIRAGKKDRR